MIFGAPIFELNLNDVVISKGWDGRNNFVVNGEPVKGEYEV